MPYRVEFKQPAADAIRDLPAKARGQVVKRIEQLKDAPRPPKCKKLSGEDDLWRIRSGDYRIVYRVTDDVLLVLVVRVAHRREVYRGDL